MDASMIARMPALATCGRLSHRDTIRANSGGKIGPAAGAEAVGTTVGTAVNCSSRISG